MIANTAANTAATTVVEDLAEVNDETVDEVGLLSDCVYFALKCCNACNLGKGYKS